MSETVVKKHRQTIKGVVVSDKMSKTRVIEVQRNFRHRLYQKNLKMTHKFLVHDEKNESKIGDTVLVAATRPLSRKKNFTLIEIVEKRVGA